VVAMLEYMPRDASLSFVVLPHGEVRSRVVDPGRLRHASRPVHVAVEDQVLQVDRVYLAPLGANVSVENARLRIAAHFRGPEVFDGFLSSLASDQNERAIGAVLSTEHRHGQRGLRAIERAGGLALGHLSWRSETGALRLERAKHDRLSEVIPARVQQHLVESQRTRQSGVPSVPRHAPKILARSPRVEALSRSLHTRAHFHLSDAKTLPGLGEHLDVLLRERHKSPIRAWVPRCGTGQRAYALA